MLFYKVLTLFWGVEHALIFGISKTYLPSLTNDSISSGFDEVPPSEKLNVL